MTIGFFNSIYEHCQLCRRLISSWFLRITVDSIRKFDEIPLEFAADARLGQITADLAITLLGVHYPINLAN
jgi:hypothetical protein